MGKTLILIGLGGGLGSMSRYLVSFYFARGSSVPFPFATFGVNVLGCLLMGLLFGCWERYQWTSQETRLFLTTGFCGGFTTFSTFALENVRLLQNGDYLFFFVYALASFVLGILAVFLGMGLCKLI